MLISFPANCNFFCQSHKVRPGCKGVKGGLEKPPSRHQTPGKRHCLSLLCKLFNGFYQQVQHHQPINASAEQSVQRFCRSGSQNSLNRTMTLLSTAWNLKIFPGPWLHFTLGQKSIPPCVLYRGSFLSQPNRLSKSTASKTNKDQALK